MWIWQTDVSVTISGPFEKTNKKIYEWEQHSWVFGYTDNQYTLTLYCAVCQGPFLLSVYVQECVVTWMATNATPKSAHTSLSFSSYGKDSTRICGCSSNLCSLTVDFRRVTEPVKWFQLQNHICFSGSAAWGSKIKGIQYWLSALLWILRIFS